LVTDAIVVPIGLEPILHGLKDRYASH